MIEKLEVCGTIQDASVAIISLIENLRRDASDTALGAFLDACCGVRLSTRAIERLARVLADSGESLAPPGATTYVDLASTGGPSSLSTLLCPIYLRSMGHFVSKLSVPGRPAGAIDVLAQIAGYQTDLSAGKFQAVLESAGFAHAVAGVKRAPLDRRLYELRRARGEVDNAGLVSASLLGKKLVSGVRLAGFDIRVAKHGNFGADRKTAESNARRLCEAARLLDIRAVCFLTDASAPYQPYIGRGESLVALAQVFDETESMWLRRHEDLCFSMASGLCERHDRVRPDKELLTRVFASHVRAQGGTVSAFNEVAAHVMRVSRVPLVSPRGGFVVMSVSALREAIVRWQTDASGELDHFTDPCGVVLNVEPAQYVQRGTVLASLRAPEGNEGAFVNDCRAAFDVVKMPIPESTSEVIKIA